MKHILHLTYILTASILIGACSGSGRMLKRGNELHAAGLNEEAVQYYMESLRRDHENIEARIALRKVGQMVIDDAYGEFFRAVRGSEDLQAIRSYRKAEDYREKLVTYRIDIARPQGHEQDYEIVLNRYVEGVYQKARQSLGQKDYTAAQVFLKEIQDLKPDYKDTGELMRVAESTPLYNEALKKYDQRKYREAYNLLKQIEARHGPFQQSPMYIKSALQNGAFGLGILDFRNHTNAEGVEVVLASRITQKLQERNDPFLKLIDRSLLDELTDEQRRSMSGQSDPNTAAEAGKLVGAKVILVGELVRYTKTEGRLQRTRKTGYMGRSQQSVNQNGERVAQLIYEKVYYYDLHQRNEVSATFQYKLVSVETGEILFTDAVMVTQADEVNYSTYNGDTRLLYMGHWTNINGRSPEDRILNDRNNKQKLDERLSASRTIQNTENLSELLYDRISDEAAEGIYRTLVNQQ